MAKGNYPTPREEPPIPAEGFLKALFKPSPETVPYVARHMRKMSRLSAFELATRYTTAEIDAMAAKITPDSRAYKQYSNEKQLKREFPVNVQKTMFRSLGLGIAAGIGLAVTGFGALAAGVFFACAAFPLGILATIAVMGPEELFMQPAQRRAARRKENIPKQIQKCADAKKLAVQIAEEKKKPRGPGVMKDFGGTIMLTLSLLATAAAIATGAVTMALVAGGASLLGLARKAVKSWKAIPAAPKKPAATTTITPPTPAQLVSDKAAATAFNNEAPPATETVEEEKKQDVTPPAAPAV